MAHDLTVDGLGLAQGLRLRSALLRPECYPHAVSVVRMIETHISWVFLTGPWAYKVKKPVDLGFLDFTTLEARRRCCEAELRLNRRLASEIYDSVVEIRGTPDRPRIGGSGALLDYAVKMREFPQDALASEMLARGAFSREHTDRLARGIAAFHGSAARAGADSPFGTPDAVLAPALENFRALETLAGDGFGREALGPLRQWTMQQHCARRAAFDLRHAEGFVRECHGDLHLRNIVVLDGRPIPFDCIEFSEALRWIDVMSEIAFLAMDFEDRGRRDLAWRFLNGYLETTGDYPGAGVLRFYLVYRALVRAKVHALRVRQAGSDEAERVRLQCAAREYVALATRHASPAQPALIITHGVSGSGKTTTTQALIERIGAVRVRSDIERKRLCGLAPLARSGAGGDIYTKASTAATYARLRSLARSILEGGYTAVVDAAFLQRAQRDAFRALAAELRVPFCVLAFDAPVGVLRERVTQRFAAGADASEADIRVLERQLEYRETIGAGEERCTIRVDTEKPLARDAFESLVQRLSLRKV